MHEGISIAFISSEKCNCSYVLFYCSCLCTFLQNNQPFYLLKLLSFTAISFKEMISFSWVLIWPDISELFVSANGRLSFGVSAINLVMYY